MAYDNYHPLVKEVFKERENAMNESSNEPTQVEPIQVEPIQVGDKVSWTQWRGDTPVEFKGRIESIGSFNGVKTLTLIKFGTLPEDRTETTLSASRVTKI